MSGLSSEAYDLHRKQLAALIQLSREGKNESKEAEALRDDMGSSWLELSDLEQREMAATSEAAYAEEKERKKEGKA